MSRDPELSARQVDRAAAAGARALVLTVDAPYVAPKPRITLPLTYTDDDALPTAHALRGVVEAVGGTVPVLVDGGVCTGTDVLIALALGARAVLVGRPVLWALALGGAYAVASLLDSYREQLSTAMAPAGAADLAGITPDLLASARERHHSRP